MADEKQSSFKITDRRKFNPDGTRRENVPEPPAPPKPAEAPEPQAAASAANVVSFPGESKKREAETPAAAPGAAAEAAKPAESPGSSAAERAYKQASGAPSTRMPEASFLGLLNMLGVEAAMHMGLIEMPGGGGVQVDLEAARHLIDMLGVLRTKTQGNLTPEEDSLFENLLADLRMQFVAISRRR